MKTATINALVSLSLDPATIDSDFIQVKYHKDQANEKDYSHEGLGFHFKKWQADKVVGMMDSGMIIFPLPFSGTACSDQRLDASGDVC